MTAAVQEWEAMVGVRPWLASATATVKTFDPQGQRFLAIPEAAVVTSISIEGEALTAGSDYYLPSQPDFYPVRVVQFDDRIFGEPKTISITAQWGFQTQIFEDVWFLVLDLATARIMEHAQKAAAFAASGGAAGSLTEVRQADITVKFGQGQASFIEYTRGKAQRLAAQYRGVRI